MIGEKPSPRAIAHGLSLTIFGALAYALLAAYLLFAHGCHGEADTELSTFISESASATAAP